jgi:hypothetical protein
MSSTKLTVLTSLASIALAAVVTGGIAYWYTPDLKSATLDSLCQNLEKYDTQPEVSSVSKLEKEDEQFGKGPEVSEGSQVEIHYVGRLLDSGEKFDSSCERGEPFQLTVGQGQVIEGWEEGLIGMHEGAIRTLRIPSEKADGEQGRGKKIPANADLKFVVEAVSVQNQSRNSGRGRLRQQQLQQLQQQQQGQQSQHGGQQQLSEQQLQQLQQQIQQQQGQPSQNGGQGQQQQGEESN